MSGSFNFGRRIGVATAISAAVLCAGWSSISVAAAKSEPPAAAAASATGTKFRADADMQAVLAAHAALGPKPIERLDAAEARKQPTPADAVMAVLKKQGKDTAPTALVPGDTSSDQTIPGPAGPLPVRIYTPAGAGPFPVVVYFHGGGWVLADKNVYDGGSRGLAKQANAVVISVDYRLAPEAMFPAQHEDALATYRGAAANAASVKGDPKRLAIAGESAGGNLAIATAIAARDQGLTQPLHVVSVYPIAQATDLATPSYQDSATAKPLNKAMMAWFADKVFSKPDDKKDSRIDLIHANLKGLPPVTLINARIDPLRSDGDMLATALKKAGVKIEHKVYDGVTHEFFGMAAVVAKAKEAQAYAGQRLMHDLADKPVSP
jgi:acetyl esterase/lipase